MNAKKFAWILCAVGCLVAVSVSEAATELTPSEDTFIWAYDSAEVDAPHGAAGLQMCSFSPTTRRQYPYIKFNLSSIAGTVSHAQLDLKTYYITATGDVDIGVYLLNEVGGVDPAWDEATLTWNNAPTAMTQLGTIPFSDNVAGDVLTFDAAALVDAMNNDSDDNLTLVLKPEDTMGYCYFLSKENGGTEPPKLTVTELPVIPTDNDTFIWAHDSAEVDAPHGAAGLQMCSFSPTTRRQYPYIHFNLSSIAGTVSHAQLDLKTYYITATGDVDIGVYLLNEVGGVDPAWDEATLTWNNAPTAMTQLGTIPFSDNVAGDVLTFDAAALVDAVNNDSDDNLTLVLKPEDTMGYCYFLSKENGGTEPPTLTVTPPTGTVIILR